MSDRDCLHGRQIGKCADCDVERLEAENEALKAELAEQARVNGMGSEREAKLLAVNAELVEALRRVRGTGVFLGAIAQEMAEAALAKTQGEMK